MRYLVTLLVLFSVNMMTAQEKRTVNADGKCGGDKWELEFEENFDGDKLNTDVWVNRGYTQGSLSNEGSEEYYTLNNVKVENGICKLIPKKETLTVRCSNWQPDTLKLGDGQVNLRTYHYTSGWIETKKSYHYGKYEIRCRIPKGKSLWPAFWMYGQRGQINNEIDVFEFWNPENFIGSYKKKKLAMEHHMTIHFNRKMSGKSYTGPDYSTDYHTFTVIWDSTKIEWLVDGELKRTATQYITKRGKNVTCDEVKSGKTYYLNPIFPDYPMVILANIALQNGKNSPDDETFLNPSLDIDYIRYYKPKD